MNPTREQIEELITIVATAEGLDPKVCIKQCAAESGFNPIAVNQQSRAYGLFQFMPATAADQHINPMRWHENVFGGVRYLGVLVRQYGSVDKGLAAYNWGPGNLTKCIAVHGDLWRDFLPTETRNYLTKITG